MTRRLRHSTVLIAAIAILASLTALGCGSDSEGPSAPQMDTTAPAVPADVTSRMLSAQPEIVEVTWAPNQNDSDLAGYMVYRSHAPDGAYLPVDDMLIQTNSWTDTQVSRGNTYYYRVSARDASSNESALSSPSGLTISVGGVEPPRVSD